MAPETKKPMMKRKRANEEDMSVRLSGKLHHFAREVKKAAKKAKDFEIRKLVKRLKGLRAKDTAPPELADLEEQLVLLKDIDHELVANTALKTKLKKDKKLAGNDDLEAAIAQELSRLITPATPGSNLAKVQGRLLSSKVVATEVHTVVEAVRVLVFPELKAPAAPADDDDADDEEDVPAPPTKKAKTSSAAAREVAEASSSEDSSEDDEAEGERVVLDEDDEAVDDGGWESGSVNGGPDSEDEDEESSDGDEESGEDEEDDEESDSAPPPKRQAKSEPSQASSSKSAVKAKAGESTFLPSLSVGFTRGDSDASDLSDGEVAKADGGMKKNRRGQRARRAIWEKKYGKNANHVKKQEEIAAKNPRDRMRKPFGKPQAGAGAQPGGRPPPHGGSRPQGRPQGTFSKPSGPPARTQEDKPMHPSWEAKRKLKEKQNAAIIPPQGKKIVF